MHCALLVSTIEMENCTNKTFRVWRWFLPANKSKSGKGSRNEGIDIYHTSAIEWETIRYTYIYIQCKIVNNGNVDCIFFEIIFIFPPGHPRE